MADGGICGGVTPALSCPPGWIKGIASRGARLPERRFNQARRRSRTRNDDDDYDDDDVDDETAAAKNHRRERRLD